MSAKQKTGRLRRQRTTFEWVILAVSVTAIAVIAGGLTFYGLSLEGTPPELRVEVAPAGRGDVIVTVDNVGGTTAEDVIVLVRRGGTVREVEFRAVTKGDFEEATVSLPGSGAATGRVAAYKEP